ncbi:hypothetical protein QIH87_50050 (plasmid) [Bradyrhizobium elkanii]|uniref:hypothetical protein n=1 Tax=Bradyrhizobium elkanii TaxID=29448 RepID=UPI002714E5BF|nr:hypothetical protein [Bradyrhizobium elkanii]WLB14775.1 hypothetical protein QIH87_50050 [Bradyrhizobium elkanii]WLB69133.1 hypothetical protein QIH89_27865 [Bradyrhizobium elkanii]
MIKQRIMYVCSECAEGCPEACGHYDRTELRVMPDGAWLCESCFDNNDDNEFLSWGHLPAPEEYGRIPASAQGARKAPKINHEAWSKSLIGFIRSKGLERELTDWCGGWKCPIQSSDGGGEVRPANTANMPGSVPGEEVSSSAGGIERTTVRETALTSCAGVTPGPSEALSGTSLARWCYENPNLAARTIEGLRALSEGHGAWQSIDTAPDDGRKIWAFGGRHEKPAIVDADGDWWRFNSKQGLTGIPTHWQPLFVPATPSSHPSTQSLRQEG